MVPGVVGGPWGRRAAVWTDKDCRALLRDVRHHQIADGGVGEGLPGYRRSLPEQSGGRTPQKDAAVQTVLERQPIQGVAPGYDKDRQISGQAGKRNIRLPVA